MGSFKRTISIVSAAGVLAAFAACGKSAAPPTAPAAAPTATTVAQAEQNALPLTVAATIPKTLKCRDEIVWVNLHRRNYHEPGDPFYGRTKNGEYVCLADALAKGYHAAGERHRIHQAGGLPTGQPTSSPY